MPVLGRSTLGPDHGSSSSANDHIHIRNFTSAFKLALHLNLNPAKAFLIAFPYFSCRDFTLQWPSQRTPTR